MRKKRFKKWLCSLAVGSFLAFLCGRYTDWQNLVREVFNAGQEAPYRIGDFALDGLPAYGGTPYVEINNGRPYFEPEERTEVPFARYGQQDEMGRCSAAYACIGKELMPTEERGSIGQVKPTGWQFSKYDFVDGKYLYNRCHLIGYQLAGENANTKNLVTGTRYMNVKGMLPFENQVADYVKKTGNHVLYRVTPVFAGPELLCRGVLMEAFSVEDEGRGVCFCVFVYNVQPGVVIDYATGENRAEKETEAFGLNNKLDGVLFHQASKSLPAQRTEGSFENRRFLTSISNPNSKYMFVSNSVPFSCIICI